MADVNQALGDEVSTNLSNEFKSAQIVFVKMDVAIDEEYEGRFITLFCHKTEPVFL